MVKGAEESVLAGARVMGSEKGEVKESEAIVAVCVKTSCGSACSDVRTPAVHNEEHRRTHGDRDLARDDLSLVHDLDDGLVLNLLLHGLHLKPVHLVPELDSVVVPALSGVGAPQDRGLRRDHQAVGREVLVTRVEDRVEHAFVEEAVAHPLRDDHVDLGREVDLFDLALDDPVSA